MANELDFQRLSSFINGITDRKIRSLSMSITGSTGYLRSLINQAQAYAQDALDRSSEASESASDADTAAASALIVWNEFTSTYVGINANEPLRSSQGNVINVGGFYIRSTDGRLRWATSINSNGDPVWSDATVSADAASILSAGSGIFLSLAATSNQTVSGPVTFNNTAIGARVTSWTSRQFATAVDVNDRFTTSNTALAAETTRAQTAETLLTNSKVSKIGDTMSGPLIINADGSNASVVLKNTATTGRTYRINSFTDGRLSITDDTANLERFSVKSDGSVVVNKSITVTEVMTSSDVVINRNDTADTGISIQSNSKTRWMLRRSNSSSIFYIARYNSNGVFTDVPFYINESDGSVVLNRTYINSHLTVKGYIYAESGSANLILNNTSGTNSSLVMIQNTGSNRWVFGRLGDTQQLVIRRYSNTGSFIDTPFYINESDNRVYMYNLKITETLVADTHISTPTLYVTPNGTGKRIAIGNNVWLGDTAISNCISIRGQSDFNTGYIKFGNAGLLLGNDSGSDVLKYGSYTVYHTGNAGALDPKSSFTVGNNGNGYWTRQESITGPVVIRQRGRRSTGWTQYGETEFSETVYFPVAYTDLNSVIVNVTPHGITYNTNRDWFIQVTAVYKDRFVVMHQRASNSEDLFYGYEWTAEGYGA